MQKELLDQLETPCVVIDMAKAEEKCDTDAGGGGCGRMQTETAY